MFDSGVMVVQLQSHSEEEMIASALDNVSFTITKHYTDTDHTARHLGYILEKNLVFILTPGLSLYLFIVPYLQVSDKGSLTAEEFAKLLGLSVLLSKER